MSKKESLVLGAPVFSGFGKYMSGAKQAFEVLAMDERCTSSKVLWA